MNIENLAKELRGLQTVRSIAKKLNISERTAVNYTWKLRKKGYLENIYGGRVRLYKISLLKKRKSGYSFYETLNKNTKVKINVREDYIIHSEKEPGIEWIIARAIASGKFRIVL